MKTPFWLDANTLIEAKRKWYRFHLVPDFWELLERRIRSGDIRTCKQVYDEWCEGGDELTSWAKRQKEVLCVGISAEIQACMTPIADFVVANFPEGQVEDFLIGADPWLIAFAQMHGGTVVTGEANKRKSKIRVPIICKHFNVPFTTLPGMLDAMDEPFSSPQ